MKEYCVELSSNLVSSGENEVSRWQLSVVVLWVYDFRPLNIFKPLIYSHIKILSLYISALGMNARIALWTKLWFALVTTQHLTNTASKGQGRMALIAPLLDEAIGTRFSTLPSCCFLQYSAWCVQHMPPDRRACPDSFFEHWARITAWVHAWHHADCRVIVISNANADSSKPKPRVDTKKNHKNANGTETIGHDRVQKIRPDASSEMYSFVLRIMPIRPTYWAALAGRDCVTPHRYKYAKPRTWKSQQGRWSQQEQTCRR